MEVEFDSVYKGLLTGRFGISIMNTEHCYTVGATAAISTAVESWSQVLIVMDKSAFKVLVIWQS